MIQGVAAEWSFPSLSANKGVNQQLMRFTPFSTPKNLIATKTTPNTKNFTIWMWRADYHCSSFGGFLSCLLTESGCKITSFCPKFQPPVKYREMKGKRVNIIDNEIFENSP